MQEVRRRIVRMSIPVLLDVLNAWKNADYVSFPEELGLPEGTHVVGVREMWECNALAIIIEHESFDPVAVGNEMQVHPHMCSLINIVPRIPKRPDCPVKCLFCKNDQLAWLGQVSETDHGFGCNDCKRFFVLKFAEEQERLRTVRQSFEDDPAK